MILGITPARGKSKGIPYKNIKPVAGKPLIAWTIEKARKSKLIDEYVVSTEDARIAGVAKRYGARVLQRPRRLAGDNVTTLEVLQHALKEIKADIVVVLQATSPVRDNGLIDRCIRKFLKSGADSLATGFICKYQPYAKNNKRRQDIKGFFYDDGNIYVIKAGLIRRGDRFGKKIVRVLLDKKYSTDIDDMFDFQVAEQVLNKNIDGE